MKPVGELDIVLASAASWRSDILHQLHIPHRCSHHRFEETAFPGGSLVEFVRQTALGKACSLTPDYPGSLIVAADQLISLDETVFYKSGSRSAAIEQLNRLNGRTHQLICAIAVVYMGKQQVRQEVAELRMRPLTAGEIAFYVDQDQPWDCAGSYKIERLGASLFESVSVRDPTTIIGLPANLLLDMLRELGYSNLL